MVMIILIFLFPWGDVLTAHLVLPVRGDQALQHGTRLAVNWQCQVPSGGIREDLPEDVAFKKWPLKSEPE